MKTIGAHTWNGKQAGYHDHLFVGLGQTPVLASVNATLQAYRAGWDTSPVLMCETEYITRVEMEDHEERYLCCLFVSGVTELAHA